MIKKVVLLAFVSVLLFSLILEIQVLIPIEAHPAIINVPGDYSTIQAAINAANPGDTINVSSDTYYEHVVVNKTVMLVGENRDATIVDGNGTGNVILVTADNVSISGFTVQNSGGFWPNSSIYLNYTSGAVISGNAIKNSQNGIYSYYGSNNTISDNVVSNIRNTGIVLWESSNDNSIHGNNITNNNAGMGVWWSTGNTIIGNNISSNSEQGVYIGESSGNIFSSNILSNNGPYLAAINLFVSSDNSFSDNVITNNLRGIEIWACNDNIISNNTITSNVEQGVRLCYGSGNNTITENNLSNNHIGIELRLSSSGNTISLNRITSNLAYGINLIEESDNNIISGNVISNSYGGIYLGHGPHDPSRCNTIISNAISENNIGIILFSDNTIIGNTLLKNHIGIHFEYLGGGNTLYYNNFINSFLQVSELYAGGNTWDDGAGKGNYWTNYVGLDDGSGGRVAGDGVGDTLIPHLGLDNYPLTTPWGPIPIVWNGSTYPVTLLSNSTISAFDFNQPLKQINFNVTGPEDTAGFCRVTIPKALLDAPPGNWTILMNGINITQKANISENNTHTFIYLTYNHTTQNIQIIGTKVIPEFPSTMILPLLLIATLAAFILAKKNAIPTSHKEGKG